MQNNQTDLYNEIGQILVSSGPEDAKNIIMIANLYPEGDVCEYEFNYISISNQEYEYEPLGRATTDLRKALVKLRQYFIDNNLTNDQPIWTDCMATVDIENSKISIEFKYEPFMNN
ncbi:hypothetical protein [Orbus mooreae]|uniref:hypothetical protein n=1 Tax=Orbus mooreae TaxID=3074107 RepID=UPI00370D58AD